MPLVHQFKRREATPIHFPGIEYLFAPNEQGDVVCEVPEGSHLKRLLSITEAFRLYGVADPAPGAGLEGRATSAQLPDFEPYLLVNGDQKLDLRALDDEQLHAFAKEQGVKVHPKAKGDTIRNRIVEALANPEPEQDAPAPAGDSGAQGAESIEGDQQPGAGTEGGAQ